MNATGMQVVTPPYSGSASETFFARFATCILVQVDADDIGGPLHASIVSQLQKDIRVTRVDAGSANHEWTMSDTMFPSSPRLGPDELLDGSDHFHSVRYSDSIMFDVHVPAKNQPKIHGETAAAEDYLAAWDGYTLLIMWRAESDALFAPAAAGQVAIDILRVATRGAGQELYVQACSPECTHLFVHKDMKVSVWTSGEFETAFTEQGVAPVEVRIQGVPIGLSLVEALHDEIKMPAAEFAEVKNTARRILDLEHAAREMAFKLIRHDYTSLKRSQESIRKRLGYAVADTWNSFRGRGRGKDAKIQIASLWLAMASIETLQQSFREADRHFLAAVSEYAIPELFETDIKGDEQSVGSIDPQFARAAVEHKSTRMDNRIIVLATMGGAIAGALIAAAVGGFFGLMGGA